MTTILDTDKALQCGSCKELIHPTQSKVIIGYSSLVIVMHSDCWEIEEIVRNERIPTNN
jgi:hypothetical protein